MSDKNLPGELYDQLEPGSQSISPNHFTANPAASENSAASQRQRILSWLRNVGPLTTLQARKQLDVLHPAARVMELRKAGHDIVTHRRFDESIRGRRHNVAEYVLVIEPGA